MTVSKQLSLSKRFLVALTLLACYECVSGRPCSAFTRSGSTSQHQAFHVGGPSVTFSSSCSVARQAQSNFLGSKMSFTTSKMRKRTCSARQSSSSLGMSFLGNDGFFGVGAPEVAVTLLVGYFILGPQDLYKLVKSIGKTLNTFREASAEATKQFNDSIESTIELDELKKTQRELMNLNDAFSFRRSINVDEDSDPFANKKVDGFADPRSGVVGESVEDVVTGAATAVATKKRKKIRRRVKKKVVQEEPVPEPTMSENSGIVEDLDMSDAFKTPEEQVAWEEEVSAIQNARKERLQQGGAADWFTASEETVTDEVLSQQSNLGPMMEESESSFAASEEQTRFASQLAGDWNEQILANEDKLSPLSKIMERLAILEEEKNAATMRMEEEFRLRGDLEEKYYKQKRAVLEEAAAMVQADAYIDMESLNTNEEEKEQEKEVVSEANNEDDGEEKEKMEEIVDDVEDEKIEVAETKDEAMEENTETLEVKAETEVKAERAEEEVEAKR